SMALHARNLNHLARNVKTELDGANCYDFPLTGMPERAAVVDIKVEAHDDGMTFTNALDVAAFVKPDPQDAFVRDSETPMKSESEDDGDNHGPDNASAVDDVMQRLAAVGAAARGEITRVCRTCPVVMKGVLLCGLIARVLSRVQVLRGH